MSTKYTKGPWKLTRVGNDYIVKSSETTRIVCSVQDAYSDAFETFQANARLIAAAPEMLEALNKIVSMMQLKSDLQQMTELDVQIFELVLEQVKKSRGD